MIKVALLLLTLIPLQDASSARFEGTWVGFQTWSIDSPPTNAKTPQPVQLDIQAIDGKLVGVMTPFFGGSDGASFSDGRIIGERFEASGVMGQPSQTRPPSGWKTGVKINFDFTATGDKNQLIGTAEVLMGDVKWTKFKYELSRKRSRY
jgi:hypothetical protein